MALATGSSQGVACSGEPAACSGLDRVWGCWNRALRVSSVLGLVCLS